MVKAERIPEGYRATEAGILPVDWQVKRLSEVATELTERAGQDMYETVSISAGIGFVNQAEKFGKELSGKQYEKYIVLHKGDFSYNKGNSKTSPQGCIYRLNDRESAAVPNVFESFRIKEQNADYYEQLFLSGFLNRQLYSRINRGVRDDGLLNLTGKDFYSCTVPVPPVDEQKKIAEVLLCCDRVIDLKQQLIIELQQLKNGFLQAVFPTKGCNKPDIRFPGFSEAWEQRKAKELCSISTGKSNTQDRVDDGIYPFYVRSPIVEHSNRYLFDEEAVLTVGDGAGTGKVFHYVNGKYDLHQRVYRMFDFSETITAKYFFYYFSNHFYDRVMAMTAKTSVDSVRYEMIADMDIALPKLQEQIAISNYFDQLEHLITLHRRELEETKKKKRGLAKLLLTGGVRVPT
jgi:type I restriction enzyme S subunit